MKNFLVTVLLVFTFTIMGCAEDPTTTSTSEESLIGAWELLSLKIDGETTTVPSGLAIRFIFRPQGPFNAVIEIPAGIVGLTTGNFTATGMYEVSNSTVTINITQASSPEVVLGSEPASFSIEGNRLKLNGEVLTFRFDDENEVATEGLTFRRIEATES